jgi:glutamate formiminotransferase
MTPPILLAVPNVSEGRDAGTIAAIGQAFAGGGREGGTSSGVRLLDVHSDGDHHRSVFTLAGQPGDLADAVLRGAEAAIARIDVMTGRHRGQSEIGRHPYVGSVDVTPIVYLDRGARGAACAVALVVADRIGVELEVPVFLYGELAGPDQKAARTRAQLRRGGVAGLAERMAAGCSAAEGGDRPDFGPLRMHPRAGATLVAARPPLVAFNLNLSPAATLTDARGIAALIREGGDEGLRGVRAIGIALSGDVAQVSMNIERPLEIPLARVLDAVNRHARVASAELVGLAPRAALEGFPENVQLSGFDPARHVIENALGS